MTMNANGQEERKKRYVRFLYHIMKNTPDRDYLLRVLGCVCKDHPIFQRGYQPPKEEKKNELANVDP